MKINNFRGELTDVSAKKEALIGTQVKGAERKRKLDCSCNETVVAGMAKADQKHMV